MGPRFHLQHLVSAVVLLAGLVGALGFAGYRLTVYRGDAAPADPRMLIPGAAAEATVLASEPDAQQAAALVPATYVYRRPRSTPTPGPAVPAGAPSAAAALAADHATIRGHIKSLSTTRLVVTTKHAGDVTVLLAPDSTYWDHKVPAHYADLQVGMRVYVLAGQVSGSYVCIRLHLYHSTKSVS